jgi:exopolysaccharide biosynthesis polyprenyl glycosylphosphotransferase
MKIKKPELFFSFLLVPIDYLVLVLAGISAYYLRFASFYREIRPVIFDLPFPAYFQSLLLVALLWLAVLILSGLYRITSARKTVQELAKVFLACSTSLALVAIYIFFQRELFDSRFIVLVGWLLAVVYLSFTHIIIRFLQRKSFFFGWGIKKVLIVGNGKTADNFIHDFSANRRFGYEVVKRVRDFSLETSQEIAEFIIGNRVDEIIQCDPNLSKAELVRLYDFANENHITFKYVADLLGIKVLRNEVFDIAGVPVIEVKRTTLEGWGKIAKRIMDIIGSGLLIIIFSPILLLVAIAIKLDSRGPIFFSLRDDGKCVTRVGEGGKLFNYFKFRSMIPDSDNMRYRELADRNLRSDGPMVKIKDDPRVTRVGQIIRRWSLDELPELFLVFIGRMSLVGPRPHLPEEVAKYEHHHRKSLTIKPGITGMAQISGRSDLLFEEEVKLDVFYIENWSLLLDFTILFKTPLAVLKHRDAE